MSIVECKLGNQHYSRSREGGITRRSVRAEYHIITDAAQGAILTEQQARLVTSPNNPLPLLWSTYSLNGESDATLFCTSISGSQTKPIKRTQWLFAVTWETLKPGELPGDDESDEGADVLDWSPRVWFELENYVEPALDATCIHGIPSPVTQEGYQLTPGSVGPVVNAAMQDWDETLIRERQRVILVVQRNVTSLDYLLDIHQKFANTLNSDQFGRAQPMHAQYRGITCGPPQFQSGVQYYEAQLRVAISRSPFTQKVPNRGWRYWDLSSGSKVLTQWTGAEPVWLQPNGELLTDGAVPNYIEYHTADSLVPYADIGL